MGVTRVLDAMRMAVPNARFTRLPAARCSAGAGGPAERDHTILSRSPYGVAKVWALDHGKLPRSYDLFAVSGILFNHESPRRGMEFVTRK